MQQHISENQARVESLVYSKNGRNYIAIGNYALDFKQEYLYLGMTASDQVILGEITQYAYGGVPEQIKKRFGKIYDNKIHVDGCRFIEKLPPFASEHDIVAGFDGDSQAAINAIYGKRGN